MILRRGIASIAPIARLSSHFDPRYEALVPRIPRFQGLRPEGVTHVDQVFPGLQHVVELDTPVERNFECARIRCAAKDANLRDLPRDALNSEDLGVEDEAVTIEDRPQAPVVVSVAPHLLTIPLHQLPGGVSRSWTMGTHCLYQATVTTKFALCAVRPSSGP